MTQVTRLLKDMRVEPTAPTMGALKKVGYSHKALADLIIEKPWVSQNELAGYFGYSASWVSNILASDAFQVYLESRKDELVDPTIKATLEERFKALTEQSLRILQEKLAQPAVLVPDGLAIKAAELGARSLGFGQVDSSAKAPPQGDRLTILAERLIVLQSNQRGRHETVEGEGKRLSELHHAACADEVQGSRSRQGESGEGAVRADLRDADSAE